MTQLSKQNSIIIFPKKGVKILTLQKCFKSQDQLSKKHLNIFIREEMQLIS